MRSRQVVLAAILASAVLAGFVPPSTAQAAKRWAVVRQNGTLVRGRDVATSTRTGPGSFVVTFDHSVAGCADVANPGDPATGTVADPVVAAVAPRANPRAVSVQTYHEGGEFDIDEPFHVAVYCGATSTYAVVRRGGALVRGAHALSARRIRLGEYGVHFDRDVSNCVLTASIGSTTTAPVVAPGMISVSPGRKPRNAFVTTIGGGGLPGDFPFHLAAACATVPLRAVVKADGTSVRGRDVVSTTRLSAGSYEVIFDRDVSGCAYTATVGRPSPGFTRRPLTITTAARGGNPDGAFVFIHHMSGAVADHAFHIVARC
ncbi:MAG TPA: hypothetical protein VH459_10840 [Gaiellales bacterium]